MLLESVPPNLNYNGKKSKSQNTKYIKNLAILTSFTLLAMMMMGGIIFVIIIIVGDVKSQ